MKLFLQGKFVNFAIRRQGRGIVRNWEAQNKDYYARLKKRGYIKKALGFQRGNT
jgi:hypothetical protein